MVTRRYNASNSLEGIWMLLALLGLLFGLIMSLTALCLRQKNRQYLDALIDLSERLPEEESPVCRPAEQDIPEAQSAREED